MKESGWSVGNDVVSCINLRYYRAMIALHKCVSATFLFSPNWRSSTEIHSVLHSIDRDTLRRKAKPSCFL